MDAKLVILLNLGKVRAFRLPPARTATAPHLDPKSIEELAMTTFEQNPDHSNRLPRGIPTNQATPMSIGEERKEQTQHVKQRIQQLSIEIVRLVDQDRSCPWCLAAPSSINRRLLTLIPAESLITLTSNLEADLTNINLEEFEDRLLEFPTKR